MKTPLQEFNRDVMALKAKVAIIFCIMVVCYFLAGCEKVSNQKPKIEVSVSSPPPKISGTVYDSLKITGVALQNLFAALSKATLSQKFINGKVDLACSVVDDQNMKMFPGIILPGSRPMSLYYLNNLKPFVAQYTTGAYLIFKACDYKEINVAYKNYVYYKVSMYNAANKRVDIIGVHVDPSPPAKADD